MSFHVHARTVSLLTLVSRVTGLVRDATLSRIFGAGVLMDAFFFAFMIPNLFRRLFGEGALAAAFLPVYAQLDRDDPQMARRLASMTVAWLAVVLGGLVIACELLLLALLALRSSAGAESAATGGLALRLTMIMLPYMPLVCLVAVLGAMLQVNNRFGPTAAAPVVLNLLIIGSAIGGTWLLGTADTDRSRHVVLVSSSVVVAGLIQVSWSLWALRRGRGESWWTRDRAQARAPMRRMLGQALPMILGLGVLQLNTFFDGLIASYPATVGDTIFGIDYPLEQGAMATVSFAQRLYQFPLGVFGIAVATAIFPALARLADDDQAFTVTVRRGLRLVMFIGLPASAGLILVREPLVAVILRGGEFSAENGHAVSRVLVGYATAVWSYSMMHVLTRAFYARGESKQPVKVAAAVVVLNLALNCTLIWTPLREAGLAWSTAICSAVQVGILLALLGRRLGRLIDPAVAASWIKSVTVTLLMVVAVGVARSLLAEATSWSSSLVSLLVLVGAGLAAVAAGSLLFRMPELGWTGGKAEN